MISKPFFGPNNFTKGHLLKIEGLVTDVTFVGSPVRAKRDIFWGDFRRFRPIQNDWGATL